MGYLTKLRELRLKLWLANSSRSRLFVWKQHSDLRRFHNVLKKCEGWAKKQIIYSVIKLSHTTTLKTIHFGRMCPYKMHLLQKLTEDDPDCLHEFYVNMMYSHDEYRLNGYSSRRNQLLIGRPWITGWSKTQLGESLGK